MLEDSVMTEIEIAVMGAQTPALLRQDTSASLTLLELTALRSVEMEWTMEPTSVTMATRLVEMGAALLVNGKQLLTLHAQRLSKTSALRLVEMGTTEEKEGTSVMMETWWQETGAAQLARLRLATTAILLIREEHSMSMKCQTGGRQTKGLASRSVEME